MRKVSVILTCALLVLLTAVFLPMRVMASEDSDLKYISEIRLGCGSDSSTAEQSLEGYTILRDSDGNCVDLNENSAGGAGSKHVYFGYITTDDLNEAITDIAVMNMEGAYMVKDYKSLLDEKMKSEIIPMIDNLTAAISDYRENYNLESGLNKDRAEYVHGILNKIIDDDTGKNVGDLLLNETKYEMGDDAYNSLSDDDKKDHADIVTLLSQANGKAAFMIEHFLTIASDTSDDTWIERLSQITYDDLIDDTGLAPSEAEKKLSKEYYDDSNTLLEMWDVFSNDINNYDSAVEAVNAYDPSEYDTAAEAFQSLDDDTNSDEAKIIRDAFYDAYIKRNEILHNMQIVAVCDKLREYEYNGGTLLDFFSRDSEDIKNSKEYIYPVAAALSPGQKAGLRFVSLLDLCSTALTDETGYSDSDIENLGDASAYEDMDRTIYQPGGVALTSDAYRDNADPTVAADDGEHSAMSIIMLAVTSERISSFLSSDIIKDQNKFEVNTVKGVLAAQKYAIVKEIGRYRKYYDEDFIKKNEVFKEYKDPIASKLFTGYSAAAAILTSFTIYFNWKDLTDKYSVEFSPVPKYMIDMRNITAFDDTGETIVINNQSSCFKVADTNRNPGDDYYNELGTASDCNGCIGKQWLAMYSVRDRTEKPILASSLKAVTGDTDIPAGYETGIHMFGTTAAQNLNDEMYVWGEKPISAFIYFQRDESVNAKTSGGLFTGGHLALFAGFGFILGAGLEIIVIIIFRKIKRIKKRTKKCPTVTREA